MATSTISIASRTTVLGVVTAFAPLPSVQPSLAACSTEIYAGGDDGTAQALAFDPYYKKYVNTDGPVCLADVVTSWWWQGVDTTRAAITSLGPKFACPPQYYGNSVALGSGTTQWFCCPTSYSMQSTNFDKPTYATQCYSSVTDSSLLIYTSSSDSPYTRVKIAITSDYYVWAPQVNGINVEQSSTSSITTTTSSISTSSSSLTGSTTSSSSTSSTNAATTTASVATQSKGLSAGASAGIGIGATLIVIALLIGGFFFWRRRKASHTEQRAELMAGYPENDTPGFPLRDKYPPTLGRSEMEAHEVPIHEIGGRERPHELAATSVHNPVRYEAYRDQSGS